VVVVLAEQRVVCKRPGWKETREALDVWERMEDALYKTIVCEKAAREEAACCSSLNSICTSLDTMCGNSLTQ